MSTATATKTMGPLRVHPANPRYFTDGSGKAVYLTGSHTWATIVDRRLDPLPLFDYPGYLDFIGGHNHNFLRLWAWEHAAWMQFTDKKVIYHPHAYPRTGPGNARDGKPKFDVSRFNLEFFDRLRARVTLARAHEIYVSVMLFQGFSIQQKGTKGIDPHKGNPWDGHPFNRENNVNGIDGDPDGTGEGRAVHTLRIPEITARQQTYVRKVVDTVGDLDHVLFEIANESDLESTAWQYRMIETVKEHEATRPMRHPVGMTFQYSGGNNEDLFASPADWISPASKDYSDDPPPADGSKVILNDSDHNGASRTDPEWVWKNFLRGHNPIVMDHYMDVRPFPDGTDRPHPQWDAIRKAMGQTLTFAQRMDLVRTRPRTDIASTGYCLAVPGLEYLVYLPEGGSVEVDLQEASGSLAVEWFNPARKITTNGSTVDGGARRTFTPPFGGHAVLYLRREGPA